MIVLGCLLEGPTQNVISKHLTFLLGCLQDQHVLLRESAAWTLARVCELHY